MSEDTTTSSSRIFVKILFQELCAYMGLPKLNQRLKDQYENPHSHHSHAQHSNCTLLKLLQRQPTFLLRKHLNVNDIVE